MTGEKLTDDEVTGGSVITNVFPNSFHTYGCPWLVQRLTRASSMAAMVGDGATLQWLIISEDGKPRRALLRL